MNLNSKIDKFLNESKYTSVLKIADALEDLTEKDVKSKISLVEKIFSSIESYGGTITYQGKEILIKLP